MCFSSRLFTYPSQLVRSDAHTSISRRATAFTGAVLARCHVNSCPFSFLRTRIAHCIALAASTSTAPRVRASHLFRCARSLLDRLACAERARQLLACKSMKTMSLSALCGLMQFCARLPLPFAPNARCGRADVQSHFHPYRIPTHYLSRRKCNY